MSSPSTAVPSPQDAAGRWAERLMNLVKQHGHVYVLLNRFNGVDERLAPLFKRASVQWPLLDPYYGDAIDRTPMLVKLTMEQLPLLDETAAVAAEAALHPALPMSQVCAWLHAEGDIERMAAHLRQRLYLWPTGRSRPVFFCYFDPRVMPRLAQLLDADELARLLGPVRLWAMPGRNGDLIELSRPPMPDVLYDSLRWNAVKVQAIERIDTVNAALRRLHRQGIRVPAGGEVKLDGLVLRAAALGLLEPDDQAAYAALAWLWPRERAPIDQDETMQRCITIAREGAPLADVAGALCNIHLQAP